MFRKLALLALCLALVSVTFVACSSSSDDSEPTPKFDTPYNFAGTWNVTATITDNDEGWNKGHVEGSTFTYKLNIQQNGTALGLNEDDVYEALDFSGTVDPVAGTFVAYFRSGCVVLTYAGHAVDNNTIAGDFVGDECPDPPSFPNGKQFAITYTATR